MRVAIAEFKQETNTFVPHPTKLADFENWHFWRGQEVISGSRDTNVEVAGFLDVLEPAGIEIVPILATFAVSGGRVARDAFELIAGELLSGLERLGPFDGVLLALHGAMVTEDDDDPDGAIIRAVRRCIGDATPLVVTMDLHANVTELCVRHADAIVMFKTSPHVDLRDTGRRGAAIMMKILTEGVRPQMAFVKMPMNIPASTHIHHLPGPFKRLMDASTALEHGRVLAAAIGAVQPWLDIGQLGWSVVVVADSDEELAATTALELSKQAWGERHELMKIDLVPPAEAIARALSAPEWPIVLSDLADGTGAGSPGDATAVLKALIDANPPRQACVAVRDPDAAEAAVRAGLGARVSLSVGGKLDNVFNSPAEVEGDVVFAGPASFRFGGGGYTGVHMDMGPCAVVRSGNVLVALISRAMLTTDPAFYRAVGIEPRDCQIVVVKSHIQFRAGYEGVAKEIFLLDSPGVSSDHLESLPFTKLRRPFFPFDAAMEWSPTVVRRSGTVRQV